MEKGVTCRRGSRRTAGTRGRASPPPRPRRRPDAAERQPREAAAAPFSPSPANAGHARRARRAARARSTRPGCGRPSRAGRRRAGARRSAPRGSSRADSRTTAARTYSNRARLLPPRPLPAATAPEGLSRMGLDRPALRATDGLRLLAAARHRPRPDDDAERRPAALGAVRASGADEAALDGFLAGSPVAERWRALGAERWDVRLEPVARARALERDTRCRGAGPAAGARRPGGDPHPRATSGLARLVAFYRAIDAAARRLLDDAPACSRRSASASARSPPGHVLPLALARPR